MKFDHISLKDGLSNFTVTAMVQDKQGFLWFGTEDGLNKYDGYTFRQYVFEPSDTAGLPSPNVTSLCVDRTGRVWIGTQNGLVVHDPSTGEFQRKTAETLNSRGSIVSLYEDPAGIMWIGTAKGVVWYDPNDDIFRPADLFGLNSIRCFADDSSGSLWVGTATDGLLCYERKNNRFTKFTSTPNDPASVSANEITSLATDARGVLWIGTSAGLCRFDSQNGNFHRYADVSKIPGSQMDETIVDLLVDRRGNLWVGTIRIGLRKYDPATDTFFRFDHEPENPHSLDKSRIRSLFEDNGGLLWVSTYRGGLNRYDPRRDQFVNVRQSTKPGKGLKTGPVYAIWEDRYRDVWIGTVGGGLNRLHPATGSMTVYQRLRKSSPMIRSSFSSESGYESEAILSLFEDSSGELWVGTADALYHYERKYDRFESFPTPRDVNGPRGQANVKCIGEDANGNIWIGTHGGGVHRFDRATKRFHTYRTDSQNTRSLSGMIVWAICKDHNGTLWFGTFGSGLCRYNSATDDFTRFTGDASFTRFNSIYSITEGPDSALWIGSFAGGMHRFDPATATVTTYMKKDGLPNNFVKAVLPDDRGFLWASTDLGISRFDPRTKMFRNYTQEDGLHDNVFLSGAYHNGRSGMMYFGGENGLTMFYPDSIRENHHIPPIVLTQVQIFDRVYEARGTEWMAKGVELRYDENFLQFEFAALDFANPLRQHYAYTMEGFDRDWIYSGNRRFARYTNLPPGEYKFRVKGSNNHGVWNNTGTALAITITPPFWGLLWVQVLAGALVVAILGFAYWYRVNKLLDLERLRIRIASDLHDDIGSSLTKISLQSELIQEGIEPNEIHQNLSNIAGMSRELVSTMSDIVWSIDARNDTWGNLIEKMRDSAASILSMRGIEVSLMHSGLDVKKKIPVDVRENLFLICKEAVNNVAKHSTARNVGIVVRNDHDKFTMVIADDGQGLRDGPRREIGHGLRNMQMRAKRLGGSVEQLNDNGLKIVLTANPM